MTMLISVVLSAALLVSAPGLPEKDGPTALTQAQAFTIVANVLGAATACEEIPHDHLSAAARQVGTLAMAKAVSVEEITNIERLLMVSAVAGRQAVEGGQTDCKTVEAAFGELEQVVMQTPV
jgi:hypothetical protein